MSAAAKPVPVIARAAAFIFGRNDVTPAHQAAFVYLATCCKNLDDEPICFPSVASVAAALNVIERTARKVLADLEQRKFVDRKFTDGRATRYVLRCLTPPQKVQGGGGQKVQGSDDGAERRIVTPGQKVQGSRVKTGRNQPISRIDESADPYQESAGVTPPQNVQGPLHQKCRGTIERTIEERKKAKKDSTRAHTRAHTREGDRPQTHLALVHNRSDEFERFWRAYPRKVGKGQAERAWITARKIASADVIITALEATTFNPDPQYIPHPTTWLNGKRWLDEGPGYTEPLSSFDRAAASIARDLEQWRDELTPTMEVMP